MLQKPLNGGSQCIKLKDGSYLRVARKRFAVLGMGRIHFNYFVHHDAGLTELGRSRPFIFRRLGFEICNGMKLSDTGNIYVTWAQNDREMFVARCSVCSVLDFVERKQCKDKISMVKAFLLVKNSR
jgi:hypothetical protein